MTDHDHGPFGQRDGGSTRTASAPVDAASTLRMIVRSALGTQLLGVLGGFAILFLLQAAYVASMKASGRALDRHGSETAAHPAVEDTRVPPPDGSFEPAPRLPHGMQ
jgi:hypothetical protein